LLTVGCSGDDHRTSKKEFVRCAVSQIEAGRAIEGDEPGSPVEIAHCHMEVGQSAASERNAVRRPPRRRFKEANGFDKPSGWLVRQNTY
jgi:hypothetical protein